MDLIEAQTTLTYVKAHHRHLEFYIPRLERILDWCRNRTVFGSTLRSIAPEPEAIEEVSREAKLLIERAKNKSAVLVGSNVRHFPIVPLGGGGRASRLHGGKRVFKVGSS